MNFLACVENHKSQKPGDKKYRGYNIIKKITHCYHLLCFVTGTNFIDLRFVNFMCL